jgi:hypothetical protein
MSYYNTTEDKDISLTKIVMSLRDLGCEYIFAYYCGGGDSGAIEYIYYFGDGFAEHFESGCLSEGDHVSDHVDIDSAPVGTEQLIEDLFHEKLNTVEDWWNNDGGYGYIALRLEDLSYLIDNNTYYTQTEHWGHEGSFKDEL